ncbi:hypothetical protein PsAD46_02453 [Pseudovibrio sp. Ad46]|nr:hypothetical protein PsAD46_02453 [Pseudovibrio sp. Ad46]
MWFLRGSEVDSLTLFAGLLYLFGVYGTINTIATLFGYKGEAVALSKSIFALWPSDEEVCRMKAGTTSKLYALCSTLIRHSIANALLIHYADTSSEQDSSL